MTATSTPPKGRLYIRLAPSSLCFARYDAREPADLGFCSYRLRPQTSLTANLREAVRTVDLLDDARRESAQLFVCGPFTLVPLTDFQEEDCAGLYDACFPPQQKRQVFYDVVPEANCVVLFALEKAACRAFSDIFPKVYYVSALTPVLRHFAAKGLGQQGRKRVFVYLHEPQATVVVFEGARLLCANTFDAPAAADAAYYTLALARQLGVCIAPVAAAAAGDTAAPQEPPRSAACDTFYVAGETAARDALADELGGYAASVCRIRPAAEFNRHAVAATPGMPYDLMLALLGRPTV